MWKRRSSQTWKRLDFHKRKIRGNSRSLIKNHSVKLNHNGNCGRVNTLMLPKEIQQLRKSKQPTASDHYQLIQKSNQNKETEKSQLPTKSSMTILSL